MTVHLFPWIEYLRGAGSAPSFALKLVTFTTALTQTTWELNSAVVVFIVLSGYCIHRSGFRDDRRDMKRYAVRRIARILPIFYFALFLGLAIGAFQTQPPSLICIASHATAISALTSHFVACELGNSPLATVTVEILLYALYAVAFWLLAWRRREHWIWIGVAVVALAGLVVAYRESADPPFYAWWQNFSLLGFIPFWWIGATFVNPAVSNNVKRWFPAWIFAYVAATIALIALTRFQSFYQQDVPPIASAIAQVRELVLAVIAGSIIVRLETVRIGYWNPFSALGRASYSLYALHTPVIFYLVSKGFPWYAVVAGNIIAAFASYLIIERPGIAIGKMFLSRQLAGGAMPVST